MALLSKSGLRDKITEGLQDSESKFLIVEATHPFLFRVYSSADDDADALDIRAYVWNCTHGGGAKRAADEYRIQITGSEPSVHSKSEVTLILGWHNALGVFAGFDIAHHKGQSADSSPSMQIKQAVLEAAAADGFSAFTKGSKEVVVAFRPEYLVQYAKQRDTVHKSTAGFAGFVKLLSKVTKLSDSEIASETDAKRKEVLVQLRRKYRAADFRKRVMAAYGNRCAMCGTQLRLVDAAHILPVSVSGSNDTTPNGVALCVLHHRGFDATLISFNQSYKIEISKKRMSILNAAALAGGAKEFEAGVGKQLLLPTNAAHHPNPSYVKAARKARGWTG